MNLNKILLTLGIAILLVSVVPAKSVYATSECDFALIAGNKIVLNSHLNHVVSVKRWAWISYDKWASIGWTMFTWSTDLAYFDTAYELGSYNHKYTVYNGYGQVLCTHTGANN